MLMLHIIHLCYFIAWQVNTGSDQANNNQEAGDEFDTTLSGPWMHRWELTNHNRHTATLQDADEAFTHKA